jgi:clan AA aspartic protease (TIGR02281 family)
MNRKALILLTLSFIVCISGASAEIIELKDGKEINASIMQETEEVIVVSKLGGGFIYSISRDRIRSIRPSPPKEIEIIEPAEKAVSSTPAAEGVVGIGDRLKKLKEYRLEQYKQEVRAAKKARGRIKIKFLKDRFGIVEALLNNKVKASLLVDSGASHVVISEEIAGRLGIKDLDEKPRIHAILADGSVATSISITLDSVQVGDSRVRNVKTAVAKTPPGPRLDGLLGMTFLRNFHVKMDAKENSLILEKY